MIPTCTYPDFYIKLVSRNTQIVLSVNLQRIMNTGVANIQLKQQ